PSGIRAAEYLRRDENKVMNDLGRIHDHADGQGIIGVTFAKRNKDLPPRRWQELARKPSEMYWNGIRTYGIYTGHFSLANLLARLDRETEHGMGGFQGDEETGDDRDTDLDEERQLFRLPEKGKDQEELSIELTPEEAEFLHDRITTTYGDRLVGLVLKNTEWGKQFIKAKDFSALCDKPFVRSLPPTVRSAMYIARYFWILIRGAHIRYNILLQRHAGSAESLMEREQEWKEWTEEMRRFPWDLYKEDELWNIVARNGRMPGHTAVFIRKWTELVRAGGRDLDQLDSLVAAQELRNKGKRSKLVSDPNEGTTYKGRVGISGMEFRYPQVRNVVQDIINGMA
ncbi:MAG: hypothetical protein ACOH13_15270, partial [Flavobacteriales bacterium]